MKKKVIVLCVLLIISLLTLFSSVFLNIALLKEKHLEYSTIPPEGSSISIMVYDETMKEYAKNDTIPVGEYELNEEKTKCIAGGTVSNYDSINGRISYVLESPDQCYLYFDILKKNIVASGEDVNGEAGTNHNIIVTVTEPSSGANIYYSTTTELTPNNYTSGSITNPTVSTEGTTTVYWCIIADKYNPMCGNNKIILQSCGTFTESSSCSSNGFKTFERYNTCTASYETTSEACTSSITCGSYSSCNGGQKYRTCSYYYGGSYMSYVDTAACNDSSTSYDSIYAYRYNGCDTYFITICYPAVCLYSDKNGESVSGTIDRSRLSASKPSSCS